MNLVPTVNYYSNMISGEKIIDQKINALEIKVQAAVSKRKRVGVRTAFDTLRRR
jgi:hypothetical protein